MVTSGRGMAAESRPRYIGDTRYGAATATPCEYAEIGRIAGRPVCGPPSKLLVPPDLTPRHRGRARLIGERHARDKAVARQGSASTCCLRQEPDAHRAIGRFTAEYPAMIFFGEGVRLLPVDVMPRLANGASIVAVEISSS